MSDTTTLLSLLKLKLNIEHPSVEDSYAYGYEAAKAGISEEDNPFLNNSRENEHWSEGWWAGFYEEEPLFTIETMQDETAVEPANDRVYSDGLGNLFVKVLEITSVIGVAAIVGYQVLDLVA
jgi:hypothetical protein